MVNFLFFTSLLLGFGGLCSLGLQVFGVSYNKKTINTIWMIIIISFSYIVFFAEPFESEDLYRHYIAADFLANSDFKISMYFASSDVNSYGPQAVWNIFIFIVGKLGIYGIIPAMGYLITRIVVLPIWSNYRIDNKDDKIYIYVILCSLALCNVHLSISGVRCACVMAILAYTYLCIYLKRVRYWQIKSLIIIIICSLIHIATIIPVTILAIYEIVQFILNSNKIKLYIKKIIKILYILGPFICVFGLPILGKILSFCNFNNYLLLISKKILDYSTNESNYMLVNKWSILNFILIGCIAYILYKSKSYVSKDYYNFTSYFIYFSLIVSFGYTVLWDRVLYFIAFLSIPAVIKAFENNKINKYFKYFYVICFGFMILIHIYSSIIYETFNGIDFYKIIFEPILGARGVM